ncbi:class I glutamine amidotransferase-like protein [Hygrophoropsis aurantiaca]|uniref:Class I glutamine amidotransferase-like protein n=1 Tax=Hygrophoropsis aurantiaca TaxID=72124 RepID=A0ACB8AHE1_9AGAM|nr:class I glutamine amidotransferase-like protein [Hygrophoropsis aurantiaca]
MTVTRPLRRIRIALLVCGPLPREEVHGDYFALYYDLLAKSLPSTRADPNVKSQDVFELIPYDVFNAQVYPPDDEHFDALLISGSASSAYEDSPWITRLVEYVRRVERERTEMKIIGICFGHQIVGCAVGAGCVRNTEWELGVYEVDLTDLGKKIFGKDVLNIQEVHRDHVPSIPTSQGFYSLGSSPLTLNQGMVKFSTPTTAPELASPSALLTNIRVLTLQGHPEFTAALVCTVADVREEAGVFGAGAAGTDSAESRAKKNASVAQEGRERAVREHDGLWIGRVVWDILGVA